MANHLAGAHRAFPLFVDWHGERMMFPVNQVCSRSVRILVRAQAPFAGVMAPVKEPKQVERLIMEEGHAVPGIRIVSARSPILQRGVLFPQNLGFPPGDRIGASAESGNLVIGQGAVPQGNVVDHAVKAPAAVKSRSNHNGAEKP